MKKKGEYMYLKNAGSDGRLGFALQHSLQEGPYGTGVRVQLSHMGPTAHERTDFTRYGLTDLREGGREGGRERKREREKERRRKGGREGGRKREKERERERERERKREGGREGNRQNRNEGVATYVNSLLKIAKLKFSGTKVHNRDNLFLFLIISLPLSVDH